MALNTKYNKILLAIIILAFAIRLSGINQPFNEDELHWAYSAETRDWLGTVMRNTPLSIYAMNFITAVFGVETWSIRLTFIIAGLSTILITAKLAKEQFSEKTAIISAFLLTIQPLHTLASLQAAYEGSFLTLFFITSIYFLFKFCQEPTSNKKYIYLTGIALGFALLSKTSAILIIPPIILIYSFLMTKKLRFAMKTMLTTIIICAVIFAIGFAIPSILLQSPALINSITQLLSQTDTIKTSMLSLLFQYSYAIIWFGPLLPLLTIYAVIYKKIDKLNLVSLLYIILFYLLIIRENSPPIERYWMILLPQASIISANALIGFISDQKNRKIIMLSFATTLIALFVINLQKSKILSFYPKIQYLEHAINLDWNFLVPITGSSGPLGFYINFITIGAIFGAVGIIIIANIVQARIKKFSYTTFMLSTIIIGASFAYNAFFLQEYLFSSTNPNIISATKQTIEFINTNNLKTPIYYYRNYALFHHFDNKYKSNRTNILPAFDYFNMTNYNKKNLKKLRETAISQPIYAELIQLQFPNDIDELANITKGTIAIIDFPHTAETEQLAKITKNCKKIKEIQDKNTSLAKIFDCSKQKTEDYLLLTIPKSNSL